MGDFDTKVGQTDPFLRAIRIH